MAPSIRSANGEHCLAHGGMDVTDRETIRNERFRVLLKRWIVERTFASISRNRRLARDVARYAGSRRRLHPHRHESHHGSGILAATASPQIHTSRWALCHT
jgi:transposase